MDRPLNRTARDQIGDSVLGIGARRQEISPVKSPEIYPDDQLRLVAHLYYNDRLDQTRLAAFMNASQAKISRMLSVARERGIVRFVVDEYEARDSRAERLLERKFGLSAVAVIRTPAGLAPEESRSFVAHFGASFIASLISPQTNVAVAGGRTIAELVRRLPEDRQRRVTVVQALGVVNSPIAHIDPLELGRSLARLWGGFFMNIDSPAIAPDKRTRDWLLGIGSNHSVWQRLGQADAAIITVGTPADSTFVNKFVANSGELSSLRKCGAVGEICGRFFDQKGRECDSHWRDQVISVELDQLRRYRQVIAIVVGRDRHNAVAAAIRGGLLKSLVIDREGAQGLLEGA